MSPQQLDARLHRASTVDDSITGDADLARKLEEVCPVDIFRATDAGVEIVRENLDECVLCELCVEAAPEGTVGSSSSTSGRRRCRAARFRPAPMRSLRPGRNATPSPPSAE